VFDPGCRGAEQMNAMKTASGACGGEWIVVVKGKK
jgi:hypothetical protein